MLHTPRSTASHSTMPPSTLPPSGIATKEDVAREHACSYTDEKLLSSLRTLRGIASRNQESLLWSVCNQTLFHTFPKLQFSEQIKNSSAINFRLLRLTDSDDAASQIRKLYAYAISQPDKCIKLVDKYLAKDTDTINRYMIGFYLTQPAFALTRQSTKRDFSLIAVALRYDNLALAQYLLKMNSGSPLTSIIKPDQFKDLFSILVNKGHSDCLRWLCSEVNNHNKIKGYVYPDAKGYEVNPALRQDGNRLFDVAVKNGDLKTVELLYEIAGDIGFKHPLHGHRLHDIYSRALSQGHLEIAEYMYERAIDSDKQAMSTTNNYQDLTQSDGSPSPDS